MRGLVIVTVVMGIMIVGGTAGLITVIVHRLGGAGAPTVPLVLDEPPGTHVTALTATTDRLALQLEGGGPERILLIDPRTATITGHISLAR